MSDWKQLYKQAAILDIETMGLGRGVGIHELAIFNTAEKSVSQFLLEPNLTVVKPGNTKQDILKLASSSTDVHSAHPGLQKLLESGQGTWRDSLIAQTLMAKGSEEGRTRGLTVKEIRSMSLEELNLGLKQNEPTIHKWLKEGKYPWLQGTLGGVGEERWDTAALKRRLAKEGADVRTATSQKITLEQLFDPEGAFLRKAKGKAIWIANVNFESKQIGAKLAALESGARQQFFAGDMPRQEYIQKLNKASGLRQVIAQTSLNTSDVLAVTGKEVNRARGVALMTGDWSGVFDAYMKHTGAGDVRDIVDVVKAQQSMSQTSGLMKGKSPFSLSMDVQGRLYGYSVAKTKEEAWKALNTKEVHAAFMDSAVTENLVLRESLRQSSALKEVQSGSKEGLRLIQQAQEGRGAFHAAIRYASAANEVGRVTQEQELKKRFSRAWQNITEKGVTHESNGYKMGKVQRVDPAGIPRSVPIAVPLQRAEYTNIADVVKHVERTGKYSLVDVASVATEMEAKFIQDGFLDANSRAFNPLEAAAGPAGPRRSKAEFQTVLAEITNSGSEYVDDHFRKVANSMGDGGRDAMFSRMESSAETNAKVAHSTTGKWGSNWKAMDISSGKALRYAGLFGAGVAVAGAVLGREHNPEMQRNGPETLRTMNYQRWLANQSQMAGLEQSHMDKSGFTRTGVAASQRKQLTDFGSPYQGPIASSLIFEHQDMLAERERYIRQTYNLAHYDENSTIGAYWKKFRLSAGGDGQPLGASLKGMVNSASASYTKYQMPGSGNYVDVSGYEGMAKGNLLKVNLSNYKMSAEDADTIVLKRRGMGGALSEFFGFNSPYKIRMAGIDAPETAHEGRAAMPYGDSATIALQSMMNGGSNLELLIDPRNQTYGRSVGFVFQDGKNLNLELLRRGSSAYLPFYKKGVKSMYDAKVFSSAEKLAQTGNRNMWGMPMYQAYKDVVAASGKTITFNTLVNPDKVAKSASLMSVRALMYTAQDQGMYNNAFSTEAASIGERFKENGYGGDYQKPKIHKVENAPHKNYIDQLLFEEGDLMATKGGRHKYKLSHRMGYGSLDKSLALDTLGTTTSIWNKRKISAYETYDVNGFDRRKRDMAHLQRYQNRQMFNSPINHHRM